MRAGSWTDTSGWAWDYKSTSEWWYRWYNQTWSWVNVNYFHDFTTSQKRGTVSLTFRGNSTPQPSLFNKVGTGDILQADWNHDGIYDHTMIVTKKDGRGYIYLTYHSSNTKDKFIVDLIYQNMDAIYRVLKLN